MVLYMNGRYENIYVGLEDTRHALHIVDVGKPCALGKNRLVVARLVQNITKLKI